MNHHRLIIAMCLIISTSSCQGNTSQSAGSRPDDKETGDTAVDANGDGDADADTDTDSDSDSDSDSESDTSAAKDTDSESADEDTDPSDDTEPEVCEKLDVALEGVPVRLMLLQDRSGSMEHEVGGTPKWDLAEVAVNDLVTTWGGQIDIGIDFFSDPEGLERCTVTSVVASDSLPDNAATITGLMSTEGPFTSDGGGRTPLYLAMQNYLRQTHAPIFMDGSVESYLVVVSDGADNCTAPGRVGGYNPTQFAELTAQILSETGIKTIVIGFGDEAEPDQLNAIAQNGGTQFTQFFDAEDGVALQEALNTIGESIHVSCTFALGELDTDAVNLDLVNVYVDDTPVPRDNGCAAGLGWSWTDATRTAIEFCEETCTVIEQGTFDTLSIEIMCSEDEVLIV